MNKVHKYKTLKSHNVITSVRDSYFGVVFDGVKFDYLTFTDVKFEKCVFKDCKFEECTFKNCSFDGSIFIDCRFNRCLSYAPTSPKRCTGVEINGHEVDLDETDFIYLLGVIN